MSDVPVNLEEKRVLPPGLVIIPGLTKEIGEQLDYKTVQVGINQVGVDFEALRRDKQAHNSTDVFLSGLNPVLTQYSFPPDSVEYARYQNAVMPARTELVRLTKESAEWPENKSYWDLYNKARLGPLRKLAIDVGAQHLRNLFGENLGNDLFPYFKSFFSSEARGFNPAQSPDPAEQLDINLYRDGLPFSAFIMHDILYLINDHIFEMWFESRSEKDQSWMPQNLFTQLFHAYREKGLDLIRLDLSPFIVNMK